MKKSKQKKLKAGGWKVGDAQEFLDLSEEEVALVEIKRMLIKMVRDVRTASGVTQADLAGMLNSSQSRIAKIEAASADVSLDLIMRTLFVLGVTRTQVGKAISQLGA